MYNGKVTNPIFFFSLNFSHFLGKQEENTKTERKLNLGEEIDGTEEGEPEVGASCTVLDSGFMLYEPEGEVDSNPLVPQEIKTLMPGVGFKQVPEFTTNTHHSGICKYGSGSKKTAYTFIVLTEKVKEEEEDDKTVLCRSVLCRWVVC